MSNLLEKASIVTTPTAYENGKILSVKPAPSLGSELITNGDFATDSNWGKINSTISGGTGNLNGTGVSSMIFQDILTNGKTYKVTFTVSNYNGLGNNDVIDHNGVPLYFVNSNGTFTFTFTQVQTNGKIYWRARNGGIFSIDNVSVKQVIDGDFDFTRNSSATRVNSQGLIEDMQILSGDLVSNGDFSQISSELVTNGDFSNGASNWTLAGLTSVVNDSVSFVDNGTNTYSIITQSNIVTANKQYKLTFDINRYVLGEIQIILGSASSVTNQLSQGVGTYTMYLPSGSGTSLEIKRNGAVPNFDFDITNISVKEVGQDWSVTSSDANNYIVFNGSTARLKFLNTSPVTQLISSFVMTAGKKYKLTVDITSITSGSIKISGSGISELFNTVGTTTRIIIPTVDTAIKFYRATANVDVTLNSVSLIEITDDTNLPRIDYTGGVGHWLFEPQSTNLIITSDSGVYGSSPASEILTTAPDGTNTAERPVPNTGSNRYTGQISGGTYATNTKITYSWYRKRISTPVIGAFVGDLRPNVLVNVTQVGSTIQVKSDVNGFDRFSATFNITDGSLAVNIRLYFGEIIGTGNSSVAYWGHQLEVGSFATSIIPTSGSTVTRLKDAAFGAGNSSLINSTQGVLYAEVAALAEQTLTRYITLSDGTSSNRIIIYITDVGVIKFFVGVGGATQAAKTVSGQTTTNFNKLAVSYKENDMKFYLNGVKVHTDTSASTFPANTLNVLNFAASNGTSSPFFGKTKCVAVFKEALTDAELTCLTTI